MEESIIIQHKTEYLDHTCYEVAITDARETSVHEVRIDDADYVRLGGRYKTKDDFLLRVMYFILQREDHRDMHLNFNISEIAIYFPDFEDVIQNVIAPKEARR